MNILENCGENASANPQPFFSIVVVCLNAEACVSATIASVLNQSYRNFEIIIKDGLSTDKTLERIPTDERIKVFKEKDSSIYDAMNQAIRYVSGKYICFLNCGDLFYDQNTLCKIHESLLNNMGKCLYGDFERKGTLYQQSKLVTPYSLYRISLCHQSVVYPSSVFDSGMIYDLSYRIGGDHEHQIRMYKAGVEFIHVAYPICTYQGDGVSESLTGAKLLKCEKRRMRKKYYSRPERICFFLKVHITLPWIRKRLFSENGPKWIWTLYRNCANVYCRNIK